MKQRNAFLLYNGIKDLKKRTGRKAQKKTKFTPASMI
jgi:hypothetical protein